MRIRYIPADPAGNLTALTLTQVRPEERAAVAAQMMARCPERFEQVGFIGEHAMTSPKFSAAMVSIV